MDKKKDKHHSKDGRGKKGSKENDYNKRLRRNSWPVESFSNNKESEKKDRREMVTKLDSLGLMVYSAIINDDLNTLKQIYKANTVTTVDRQGNTALHTAAKTGNIVMLKWLLKNSSTAILEKNYRGETCAHSAVSRGVTSHCLKILKVVVYSGKVKPIVIASEQDDNGMTVLHLATVSGHTNVVCWLVETFGRTLVIMRNNYGQTALHFAAAKGHLKIIHTVSRYGKFIVNMKDKLGATPVFYAAQEGHLECLNYLVTILRGDPHTYTEHLLTPLIVASQAGHIDVVSYLLEGCQEEHVMHQCQDGATAFHMAAANGHLQVLRILLTHKSSKEAIHIRDMSGRSPAHDAAQHNHTDCLKLLIENGLNPHQPNETGVTPYKLALQSNDPECRNYASTLNIDCVPFSSNSHGMITKTITTTGSVMPTLRPPESPQSSNSPSAERTKVNRIDDCQLPQKRKYRRSADILHKIKSLYSGKSKSATDSPTSRLSTSSEMFLKTLSTTGPKKPYHDRDKQLYHQSNRQAPLSLPYVDKADITENTDYYHYQNKLSRKIYDGHSGESGYMSDKIIRYDFENNSNDLYKAKSCDNLTRDDNDNYLVQGQRKKDHVKFEEKKHKRSRSYDNTLKSHGYLLPHKLVWTTTEHIKAKESDMNNRNGQPNSHGQEHPRDIEKVKQESKKIDYSKPGAVVVLGNKTISPNKSFLHSKAESKQSQPWRHNLSHNQGNTSSDTDDYPNLPPIPEHIRTNHHNNGYEDYEATANNDIYSRHIPTYLPQEQTVVTESIYYDPDMEKSPVVRRKYSVEYNYLGEGHFRRGRKASKSPPPLPPPRPASQMTILSETTQDIDTESIASSIPSDTPPEPLIDYIENTPLMTNVIPPAPPLPPPETLHPKKMKSLTEIIKENKAKNINKKKAPNKPPRRNKKNKRKSKSQESKKRVSSKIEQIGKLLEDSGALEPFQEYPVSKRDSSDIYAHHFNPPSKNSSRNTSPAAPHSVSPTSPREVNHKFSYLPNGILLKPRLRHIDRPSIRQARKDQVTRRDRAAYKQKDVSRPTANYSGIDSGFHRNRDHGGRFMNKKDSKEYYAVADTLKRQKEKNRHLPLPDFNKAAQLEVTESPPSELELFFKKRKERLQDMDLYARQHEVLEAINIKEYS